MRGRPTSLQIIDLQYLFPRSGAVSDTLLLLQHISQNIFTTFQKDIYIHKKERLNNTKIKTKQKYTYRILYTLNKDYKNTNIILYIDLKYPRMSKARVRGNFTALEC